jgi:hypothetical protein
MRVAVITPYYREPLDILRNCHQSVMNQTHPCTHFMVADGFPVAEVATWPVRHNTLSAAHDDVGNTPRAVGSLCAMNEGFEAIAFLDADNWYYPEHIETMVKLHERTGAAVCSTVYSIHRLDGSFMFVDPQSDGVNHVDTNCYFLTREAFRLLPQWAMMPPQMGAIGDKVMWSLVVDLKLPRAHNPTPTVAFRSRYELHYLQIGEKPPEGAKTSDNSFGKAARWWMEMSPEVRDEWKRRMGLLR